MFIDASALMALLADEDQARELLERRPRTGTRLTSPSAFWQATIAVAASSTFRSPKRRRRCTCISC
jgi:ribonuclease VapC